MKLKSLIILLVLAGGLGTYIYYGIQKPAEEKAAKGGDVLATGDLSKLEWIEIQIKKDKIRLEKTGTSWHLTEPVKDLASETKVNNLITAIQKFKKTKVIVDAEKLKAGKDISQFGVNDPKAKLVYKTSDQSQTVSFTLGGPNPSFSGTYVQINSAPEVLLATMDLDYLGTQRVDDFREMRLTTVASEQMTALEVRRGSQSMTFKKTGEAWTMTSPWQFPVDDEALKGLIEKVSLVRANSFLTQPPNVKTPDIQVIAGFAEGVSDGRTTTADTRPHGVQIDFYRELNPQPVKSKSKGPSAPGETEKYSYYAKSDKTPLAAISKFHYENFEKKPEDFVRKSFDDFLISDVEKLSIKRPSAKPVQITRKPDAGYEAIRDQKTAQANPKNVEDILRQLRSLKALKFVDLRKPETTKPASLTIDLDLKGGEKRSFIFELKKDIGELYHQNGGQWLRFVTSPEPIKVSSFDFDYLTKAEEKTEKKE